MDLILRKLRNAFTLGAPVGQNQADIFASAFNTTKLWNKVIVQCAVIRTKLFSKCGQVQRNVVVTAIAISRDLVPVLDALTNRSVRADVCHAALLSGGSYYRKNIKRTNHALNQEGVAV